MWQLCRIGRIYYFSAAHWLPKVYDGHKCKNMHGHNYTVEVEFRGEIAPKDGFCGSLDFADLDKHVKPVIDSLDHKCLNDFIENPTAENLASYILENINRNLSIFFSVKVFENDRSWAMVVNRQGMFKAVHKE